MVWRGVIEVTLFGNEQLKLVKILGSRTSELRKWYAA